MRRGRYAPSPTGGLHLGNARTALVAWWRARAARASFVLRVEDLDRPRTVPAAVHGNLAELRWLGLDWDEGPDVSGPYGPYLQSERTAAYEAALGRLTADGATFACWLSRKDLRELASAPHGPTPPYGRRERARNARAETAKRAAGRTPAVRLRVGPGTVAWTDRLAGPQAFDLEAEVGDLVLRRADGLFAYALAVVVDDAVMGIEEVVRGDDLLQATAAQIALQRALGLPTPAYAHVPLLLGPDGMRLSKRRGDRTLHALRDAGVRPERVVGLLAATLGLLPEPSETSAAELIDVGGAADLPRAPGRLTEAHETWLHGG